MKTRRVGNRRRADEIFNGAAVKILLLVLEFASHDQRSPHQVSFFLALWFFFLVLAHLVSQISVDLLSVHLVQR